MLINKKLVLALIFCVRYVLMYSVELPEKHAHHTEIESPREDFVNPKDNTKVSFELNNKNDTVANIIVKTEDQKTYKDLVEMVLKTTNIRKHSHKKAKLFKKHLKNLVLLKAKNVAEKLGKRKIHDKLMINFVFLTRL